MPILESMSRVTDFVLGRGSAGRKTEERPAKTRGRKPSATFSEKVEVFLSRQKLGASLRTMAEIAGKSYETLRRWEAEVVRSGVLMLAWEKASSEFSYDSRDVVVDSSVCLAPSGGELSGRAALYRYRFGTKIHLATDKNGMPMAWTLSAANRQDMSQIENVLENVQRMERPVTNVHMDKGYDGKRAEKAAESIGAKARIVRKSNRKNKEDDAAGLGHVRAVVERTFAWIKRGWPGLAKRTTRSAAVFDAGIAAAAIDILLRNSG